MKRRWEWTRVERWATLDNLQIWSWWGKSLSLWKSSNLPRQGSFYLKLYLFPFAYIFIWPLWTQNFLVVYLFSNKPFRVQVKPVRAGPGVRRIRRAAVSLHGTSIPLQTLPCGVKSTSWRALLSPVWLWHFPQRAHQVRGTELQENLSLASIYSQKACSWAKPGRQFEV